MAQRCRVLVLDDTDGYYRVQHGIPPNGRLGIQPARCHRHDLLAGAMGTATRMAGLALARQLTNDYGVCWRGSEFGHDISGQPAADSGKNPGIRPRVGIG